jgi:hypothetical protein
VRRGPQRFSEAGGGGGAAIELQQVEYGEALHSSSWDRAMQTTTFCERELDCRSEHRKLEDMDMT